MQRHASRALHLVSLLVLAGAVFLDLPMWFGFIGLALGAAALAAPEPAAS